MRSYGQYCGLARALDAVGDRWTLLIVRELAIAPRRYGELLDGLPGIATNLLADRLRHLEEHGVVTRSGNGRGSTYALTERGQALEPVLLDLARWGGATLVDRQPGDAFRPHWLELGLRSLFAARDDSGADAGEAARPIVVELRAEGGAVQVVLGAPTGPVVTSGPAPAPDVVLAGDAHQVLGVVSGLLPFEVLEVVAGPSRAVRTARRRLCPAHPVVEPTTLPR